MSIKKAVFPVAGLGTRFLPATKASPKEMLPVIDKPIIQYAVDEAVAAGIKQLIFVTSYSKRAIEDHFDSNFELEYTLEQRGKQALLETVQSIIPEDVECIYVRQKKALGLGHAVLCAAPLIGDEHFAVLLADDLIIAEGCNCLQQMITRHEQQQANVIAVEQVDSARISQYGVVAVDPNHDANAYRINDVVEKPNADVAPSNLGIVGRYILSADIFQHLRQTQAGSGNEIQLTDAISQLLQQQPSYALAFSGQRFDCGDKLGYLEASLAVGLRHPELKHDFQQLLKKYV